MYLEFLYLVYDYWKTLNWREVVYEVVLPAVFSFLAVAFLDLENEKVELYIIALCNNIVTLVGVIVGFSITCLTILSTASTDKVELLKRSETKKIVSNKRLSLYQLIMAHFSYSILIEVVSLLLAFFYPIFNESVEGILVRKVILFFMYFFLLHALLITIRNITNFYLVLR